MTPARFASPRNGIGRGLAGGGDRRQAVVVPSSSKGKGRGATRSQQVRLSLSHGLAWVQVARSSGCRTGSSSPPPPTFPPPDLVGRGQYVRSAGWSHSARFSIAITNKDPKKCKYSDVLHRFWKKA